MNSALDIVNIMLFRLWIVLYSSEKCSVVVAVVANILVGIVLQTLPLNGSSNPNSLHLSLAGLLSLPCIYKVQGGRYIRAEFIHKICGCASLSLLPRIYLQFSMSTVAPHFNLWFFRWISAVPQAY